MEPRIAIVGTGAIGGYCGAHFARAGKDVTLIDGWPEHVETMRAQGLRITGMTPAECFTTPVRALHLCDVPQFVREKPFDVAFVSVKSYDTEWATRLIAPYLAPDGFVVSLQNCINEECVASVVGWQKTMGCIVSVLGAELVEAGQVLRTTPLGDAGHPGMRVGEVHGRITPRARMVADLMGLCEASMVTHNLWGERWTKLVINSMRNGLSACTGMSGKQRDLTESTRWIGIRLASQAIRVAQALGYSLESVAGMDPERLARAGEGDRDALPPVVDRMIEIISARSDEQRPSMGQDIRTGRRTETDFINGFVHERGKEIGVAAPLHGKINELVKRVECGEAKASPELVAGL